jgi:hypothetical protein
VELLGRDVWSELNRYLLLVTVDIGDPGIEQELLALLPSGTQVSGLGDFDSLQVWPGPPSNNWETTPPAADSARSV